MITNALSAGWTLGTHQVFATRRKWLSVIVVLLPALVALPPRLFSGSPPAFIYGQLVMTLFTAILVPFVAIFWGGAVISDEVEGKTLVYLWTRPTGRMAVLASKLVAVFFWQVLLLLAALLGVFLVLYAGRSSLTVQSELQALAWDLLGLGGGAAAYGALGFFLAALVKKPLGIGLVYIFAWDNIVNYLPGYLKMTSIRHFIMVLKSQGPSIEPKNQFTSFLAESTTTDAQAITAISVVIVVCLGFAWALLHRKEYLGDDPARSQ
ncbi:MAG: ABC transporter permease [Candidatus Sumerlaeaceae bacterium]|nr:ABC transporter permease [Candidatus Sumerlaeaceae bacterium]